MNFLRSFCCLFGSRCIPEDVKSTGETARREPSGPPDLGQTDAELEKTGKEQMSHMEGGEASKSVDKEATGPVPREPRP